MVTRTDLRHRLPAVTAPRPDARLRIVRGTDALWSTDTTELVDQAARFFTTRSD